MGRDQELYRFGDYELDVPRAELRRCGQPVKIFPRAFDLLLHLVRHRERMVPREELLSTLWPDVTVTNAVLTQTVWELRKALRDGSGRAELIRNSRGRGYRFAAKVVVSGVANPESRPEPRPGMPPTPVVELAPDALPRALAQAYVGREPELQRLRSAYEAVLAGRGCVLLLGGEPGIGKTRAAEEVMGFARASGALALDGRCYEGQGGPPFWPFMQIVRRLLQASAPETLREQLGTGAPDLCRLVPELRLQFPEIPEPPPRLADEDRFYLLDSVAQFLVRASAARPLVLLLDDLQWADHGSLLLLEALSRITSRSRIMLLGTYRTTEVGDGQPFAQSLASLEKSCEHLMLTGLSEREVERLLRAESSSPIDEQLASDVHHVTAGNPLFVIQIARLMASDDASRAALAAGGLALPDEVRDVIGRRIALLPRECGEVLRWAAALGLRFRFADLLRVTQLRQDELLRLLHLGLDARVLAEEQLGAYRFTHPLIRESLYQGLRMPERARLHQRIGEAIEHQSGPDAASRLDELAHHFCEAAAIGSAEKAVDYAARAAERAFAATAYEAAAEYYEKALHALELTSPVDAGRGAELRLKCAEALRGARQDPERVRAIYREVAEFAEGRGDAELLARAALGYSGLGPLRIWLTREPGTVDPVEVGLLERALRALPEDDSALRALALGQLANALYNTRERLRREQLGDASVAMARRLDQPEVLAEVLLLRNRVLTAPDQLDQRMALISELIELTHVIELKGLELDAHVQRAFLSLQKCELAAAEADIATAVRLAEEMQQPDEKDWAAGFEVLRLFWQGRFAEGEAESRRLGEKRAHRGARGIDQGHVIRTFAAGWLKGHGAQQVEPLVALAARYPLPVVWRCSLASLYAVVGQFDEARREIDRLAVHDFQDLPYDHNWLSCHMYLAYACRLLEDRERAALIHAALQPYADRVILLGHASSYAGPICHTIALTAITLGRLEEAERLLEQAIERNAVFGARPWQALAEFDYAELLLRRGTPRDRRRAKPLLDSALATAHELELGEILNRAARLPEARMPASVEQ